MKENLSLESPALGVRLDSIQASDGERLRQWKNAHRFAFFFQDIITLEQQAQWFQNYLNRGDDYMFIARAQGTPIGCMGFRMIDQHADIYNVILGESEFGGKGWMGQALRLMCSFIASEFSRDISAQVLKANPALAWYQRNGFRELTRHETHIDIALDWTQFHPCPFEKRSQVR